LIPICFRSLDDLRSRGGWAAQGFDIHHRGAVAGVTRASFVELSGRAR